jgi:hypothetical protein
MQCSARMMRRTAHAWHANVSANARLAHFLSASADVMTRLE